MISTIKNLLSGFSAEKLAVVTALAFSTTIILSNLVGFFWLNMPLIFLASVIVSLWLARGYVSQETDKRLLPLAMLLFILLIYPMLLISPVFPASNDAVSTTAMRAMQEKIPLDYAQYSKINMSYPIGLPIMAKALNSIAPIIPDYLAPYSIGLIAGLLQLFFVYLIACILFQNKKAGIVSAALFFAGKYVYENIYVGELGWYLGSALMLAFIFLFLKGSRLKYVVFPAIFLVHPVAGFNTLLFLAAYYLADRKKAIEDLAKLFSTLIIALPGIVAAYLPIFVNIFTSKNNTSETMSLLKLFTMLPFWIGTGLTVIAIVSGLYLFLSRKKFAVERGHKIIISLFIVSMIAMSVLQLLQFMLAFKVIELLIFSVVFFVGGMLSSKELGLMTGKKEAALLLGILIIGMVFFSSSSILEHYRSGSKINLEARDFSKAFYNFDKSQKRVLFLTIYAGKIAEYSNKIPFDITAAHSIISFDFMYYHDAAFYEMRKNAQVWKDIFYGKKTDLIGNLEVDYIVVNVKEFPIELNYPLAFEYKDFKVYKKS